MSFFTQAVSRIKESYPFVFHDTLVEKTHLLQQEIITNLC